MANSLGLTGTALTRYVMEPRSGLYKWSFRLNSFGKSIVFLGVTHTCRRRTDHIGVVVELDGKLHWSQSGDKEGLSTWTDFSDNFCSAQCDQVTDGDRDVQLVHAVTTGYLPPAKIIQLPSMITLVLNTQKREITIDVDGLKDTRTIGGSSNFATYSKNVDARIEMVQWPAPWIQPTQLPRQRLWLSPPRSLLPPPLAQPPPQPPVQPPPTSPDHSDGQPAEPVVVGAEPMHETNELPASPRAEPDQPNDATPPQQLPLTFPARRRDSNEVEHEPKRRKLASTLIVDHPKKLRAITLDLILPLAGWLRRTNVLGISGNLQARIKLLSETIGFKEPTFFDTGYRRFESDAVMFALFHGDIIMFREQEPSNSTLMTALLCRVHPEIEAPLLDTITNAVLAISTLANNYEHMDMLFPALGPIVGSGSINLS